jgi:hypothetical protein
MPFSRSQQGQFRVLVAAAWQLHCRRSGVPAKDKTAHTAWYVAALKKATGHSSTTKCNSGRHWERACAHFEQLGEGGITYQLKLIQGDLKRIRHAVQRINPAHLRQWPTDAALESYLLGIAINARFGSVPLYELTDAQIQVVTRAICIDAHRALGKTPNP